ncbi:MAG TPA: nucleotidyltransferase family protein [Bryobacteraceae bacterium]|nr:nucleotidyltransferase family protein [Bryobacteraceae bacterium]
MGGNPSGTVELFLLCARTGLSESDCERIREIVRNGPDWDLMLSLAERNEVMGLVHSSLSGVCPELLPRAIRSRLRSTALLYASDGLQLTVKLAEVLQLFETEGIEAVVLKGPPLAVSLYGGVSLRRFGDLDILIHFDDFSRARDLLLRNGFQWDGKGSECEPGTLSETDKHLSLVHSTQGVALELHWSCEEPAARFALTTEDVFQSAARVLLPDGTPARCPGPEEQFLLLAAHGARHGWKHLKWVCDIAGLIRKRTDMELHAVLKRARELGCRRRVLLALAVAAELLGAPLPAPVLGEVEATRSLQKLVIEIRGTVTSPQQDRPPKTSEIAEDRQLRFAMYCRERAWDRLLLAGTRYSSSVLPNSRDFEFVKLPAGFRWLYWLVRPVRLLCCYGLRCFTEPSRWFAESIRG